MPLTTYIWKVASRCNLACHYCYIYNHEDHSWRDQPRLMSESVARKASERILEYCKTHDLKSISINLHGGEPLLGGVNHIRMLTSVVDGFFFPRGIRASISVQTNGLLFNRAIGEELLRNRVSVWVSLDGNSKANDKHRIDHQGQPTSKLLLQRLKLITSKRYRSIFAGFLCVIDITNDPCEMIDHLLQFSPPALDLLLPLNNHDHLPPGKKKPCEGTEYADWLIACFDHWFFLNTSTRIRTFDAVMALLCGLRAPGNFLGTERHNVIVIETNGDIEADDTLKSAFHGAAKLGYNVFENTMDDVLADSAALPELQGRVLSEECINCSFLRVCGGGLLAHRYSSIRGFRNPSVYCSDLQKLIKHIQQRMQKELQPLSQAKESTSLADP